jgi:hypothetical protein
VLAPAIYIVLEISFAENSSSSVGFSPSFDIVFSGTQYSSAPFVPYRNGRKTAHTRLEWFVSPDTLHSSGTELLLFSRDVVVLIVISIAAFGEGIDDDGGKLMGLNSRSRRRTAR